VISSYREREKLQKKKRDLGVKTEEDLQKMGSATVG